MSELTHISAAESTTEGKSDDGTLNGTLRRLLHSLARLCLANGITFSTVEEVLKRAFVQAAKTLQPVAPEYGMVSRISTVTGINRREVTRLRSLATAEAFSAKQPLSAEVFARWTNGADWKDENGTPYILKRLGPAPSFETLAQTITRDVHPRSMLDELVRLGIVHHDEKLDLVSLTRNDFVPRGDSKQMISFLCDNVGDHLDAAVDNVLLDGDRHLEQAVFADELSADSVGILKPFVTTRWLELRDALVPMISDLIEVDQRTGRQQNQRVRIGLYTFTESAPDPEIPRQGNMVRRFRKSNKKENHT